MTQNLTRKLTLNIGGKKTHSRHESEMHDFLEAHPSKYYEKVIC